MLNSQKWDEDGSDTEDIKQLGGGGNPVSLPFDHTGRPGEGGRLIVPTSLEMCWQIPHC